MNPSILSPPAGSDRTMRGQFLLSVVTLDFPVDSPGASGFSLLCRSDEMIRGGHRPLQMIGGCGEFL